MARPSSRYPTELEFEILKVLWQAGPSSVKDVREALKPSRALAYTSVMTIMNIMTRKGYLERSRESRSYIYSPLIRDEDVSGGMLGDIVNRAFDGSALAVMTNLIESGGFDGKELKKLRKLINRKVKEEGK